MKYNKKKIVLVLSTEVLIPSDLVGCIMPLEYLKIPKLIIKKNSNVSEILDKINPQLIILGKCFHYNMIKLAVEAKKRSIIIISCFNDWHFKPINKKQEIQFKINNDLIKESSFNVVKSDDARYLIKKHTGFDSFVIPDCLRFKDFEIPTIFNNKSKLLWFGSSANHDTLLKGLDEIENTKIQIRVNVVSNITQSLIENFKNKNYQHIKIHLFPYSDKILTNVAFQSDAIIIPLINDAARQVKSSNRIIDSLHFGRFIIKSYVDANLIFDKYCFVGDVGDGVKWLFKNNKMAIKNALEGQDYVKKNYSIRKISQMWLNIIKKT